MQQLPALLGPSELELLHGAQARPAGARASAVSSALLASSGFGGVERDADEGPALAGAGSATP